MGTHNNNPNYELLKKEWTTRAPVAQTLQSVRQPCLRTTTTCAYTFARFSFSGTFKPTRTSSSETTELKTTVVTAPVKPQERQITSCLRRAEQHARPSHKHCKACGTHAYAPPLRARTRLQGFCSVENSNQPVPVPVTQRIETTWRQL